LRVSDTTLTYGFSKLGNWHLIGMIGKLYLYKMLNTIVTLASKIRSVSSGFSLLNTLTIVLLYRNTVPSRDCFSIIERTTEITYFFALTLIFVLRANLRGSQTSNNIRAIIELFILLFVLIKLKLNVIFWEKKMNQLLVYGVCALIGCSASYILVQTSGLHIRESQRTLVCVVIS